MQNKILIFDFDGTVADTFDLVLTIGNRLLTEDNLRNIQSHEIEQLKDMSVLEIIRYLHIPMKKVPALVMRVRKELNKQMPLVKPVKGLKEVLLMLRSYGINMGILTSNSRQNVTEFLQNNELEVDFISASSKILGKRMQLKALMRKEGLQSSNVLYIADEIRDIEAAKRADIRIAAVTWGYNSQNALKAYNPDYLVSDPKELLQICEPVPK
jgi:phosphoglycolate phosphatase-like HAD superfamily hydrolase